MLRSTTFVVMSSVLWLGAVGVASAQSDNHAAPGVANPNSPRYLPNGEIEPPPSMQSSGGVGSQFNPYNNAQTRSGGPSGGGNQGGGQ